MLKQRIVICLCAAVLNLSQFSSCAVKSNQDSEQPADSLAFVSCGTSVFIQLSDADILHVKINSANSLFRKEELFFDLAEEKQVSVKVLRFASKGALLQYCTDVMPRNFLEPEVIFEQVKSGHLSIILSEESTELARKGFPFTAKVLIQGLIFADYSNRPVTLQLSSVVFGHTPG